MRLGILEARHAVVLLLWYCVYETLHQHHWRLTVVSQLVCQLSNIQTLKQVHDYRPRGTIDCSIVHTQTVDSVWVQLDE